MPKRARIPLFPLPDVVHFPETDLQLHVFEPRYRRMVRDVCERAEPERWIGMVLLRPAPEQGFGDPPPIFTAGTAGRLVKVDYLPDGRSNIVLRGEFRFAVESEVGELALPYRQAVVRPLDEPRIDESDPGVVAVRRELLETARFLLAETGETFPFDAEDLEILASKESFGALVNGLAAGLDVPALRKIELLGTVLPERAVELLGIVRSRRRLVDLLRPYRHLVAGAEWN